MIKNKFAKWIEWLLDLLPLFAVLFSCLYVTFNDNAFESYTGNVTETEYITFDETHMPLYGVYYNLTYNNTLPAAGTSIYFDNVEIIQSNLTEQQKLSLLDTNRISIWYNSTYDATYITWSNLGTNLSTTNTTLLIKFDVLNIASALNGKQIVFNKIEINGLDNAFQYSLYKFNELGFDKLNFINWFTGLFLNGTSNVYTTFINGYLNYFLLVECTYVLPMVLYWFIHLGERLISKLEYGGAK